MPCLDLDLSRTSVFLDFDGTISTRDVGIHLLERTGADGWWELHEEYERGEIGSRECIYDQWALVEGDEAALRAFAAEVPLDAGLRAARRDLRGRGAEVTVVSDGFGFYVEEACATLGVEVLTNAVDFATRELRFPHEDRCCPCSSCGVCKQAPIKDAKYRGQTTVLVGDGASDRKAALLADIVFAKDSLAEWCATFGVPAWPFATLDDVRQALVAHLDQTGVSKPGMRWFGDAGSLSWRPVPGAAFEERERVAVRILEERHPLFLAGVAELTGVVTEHEVRLADEFHATRLQRGVRGVDVLDREVEDRRVGAVLEQEAGVAEIEERKAGRVELRDERETEHVLVERHRAVEIGCPLADLVQAADPEWIGHRPTIRVHRARVAGW